MKYTLLAIIVACVVIFIASGCAVYYPTSYRAFIPKQWDSEYKEYKRLCRENIGKVVYARPITKEEFEKMNALKDSEEGYDFFSQSYIPISKSIYEFRMSLHKDFRVYKQEASSIVYQVVIGYAYDRHWTKYDFLHKGYPTSKKILGCRIYIDEKDFLTMAFKEQCDVGAKEDILFTRIWFYPKEDNDNVR